MATIKIKRSETTGNTPASLAYGETGINITDKKIFIGNSSDVATLIVDGNATGGVSSFNTRIGAVSLTSSDVATALGYTPQRQEPTLTAIANLSPDADDLIYFSGTDGAAITTLTSFGRSLIDDINASTARTTLGLAIGTNVQAWDADLDSIAALSGTSGVLTKTAANSWSLDTATYWTSSNDGTGSGLDADLIKGVDGNRILEEIQTGLLYGGIITINGSDNTKIDITAGAGIVTSVNASTTTYPSPTLQIVTWTAKTGVSVSGIASNDFTFVRIDSSGNVQQSNSDFTQTEYLNSIVLGNVVHPNRTSIARVHYHPIVAYASSAQYETFIRYFGPLKVSGYAMSGYLTSGRIQHASGVAFALGSNMDVDVNNPSLVTDSSAVPISELYYLYRNADGSYKTNPTPVTTVQFGKYDDGSGTLGTISNNNWSTQRVYKIAGQNAVYVYYGTKSYSTDVVATANLLTELTTEADITRFNGVFLGWMIVRGGGSNASSTGDCIFIPGGFFRNTNGGGGAATISNLDDLGDVAITSASANQLLYFKPSTSLWENASASTIGLVTLTGGETLTNKTISGSSNTISNIGNSSLTNSSITVNGSSISLGGSATVTANTTNALTIGTGLSGSSFNGSSAVTIAIDSTVATLTGGQTLTNKTISGSSNTISNIGNSSLSNSSITVNGSTISLGGSATVTATATNALTLGTGLTGSTYNGSALVTAAVDTSTIATRAYVDSVAQGLHAHVTVKTATTATLASLTGTTVTYSGGAITWTGGTAATAASFCDGTTLTANTTETSADKILVKNEGDGGGLGASKNGTYYVYAARELRRTSDGDTAADWAGGDFCFVTDGTSYDNTGWVQTQKITTLDTDSILWQQFSGAGTYTADETTLTKTGSVFSIKSTYTGQTSIVTLGTVTTGTWNASTIGATKGGTGLTTYALGDLIYSSAANTLSALTGNTTTTKKFLSQTGTGSVSAAPAWDTVSKSDVGLGSVENTALSTWAGSTNITTLGTIGTGTWNATTIGTTKGGTGLTSFTSGGLLYASSTSALTTGSVFTITSSGAQSTLNITGTKGIQQLNITQTNATASSATLTASYDIGGPYGFATLDLTSTAGGNTLVMHSGDGVFSIFQESATPLHMTVTPNTWGEGFSIIEVDEIGGPPKLRIGDAGGAYANNYIEFYIDGSLNSMELRSGTIKINTTTPAAGKVLTCTDSNGTVSWQDNTGATLALYNSGVI